MKINDILGEDDTMKIKAVSGNDVTIDQGGQEIKTTTDALTPSADKPGSFTMKPADPNQMKPGATVSQSGDQETSEDASGSDPQTAQLTQLMNQAKEPWLKNFYAYRINYLKDQKDFAGEPGAGNGAPLDGRGNLKPVEPDPMKWIQQNPTIAKDMPYDALPPGMKQPNAIQQGWNKLKGTFGVQEEHDTIASGNQDVGGDATDNFINQVRDKGFERANRNSPEQGTRSPVPGKLRETDELMKWLTIAGIK
jgi:hypothetical protein